MAQGVLVFAEVTQEGLAAIAKEMLGAGRRLADALGEPLMAAVLGSGVQESAQEAVYHGADSVYVADAPALEHYETLPYSAVMAQIEELERAEIVMGSLAAGSAIVVTGSLAESLAVANSYAPEHLCLLVADPWRYLDQVQNAGGVFLGERSFEVLGDYVAGPSHVMPTGGTARFASPINVHDFVKIISVIGLNERAEAAIGPAAELLAQVEGLTAHAAAVRRRRD